MQKTIELTDTKVYGLGFFDGIEKEYPTLTLSNAIKDLVLTGDITEETTTPEIRTQLLATILKEIAYPDFKRLGQYLFSYRRDQETITARDLEVTPDLFHLIQANPEAYLY
ncbi:TPA: hypothetical protein U2C93_001443 [Streptococcus suis]|uniref:hypothetical protein n=1 Tax=Streptococcus suis TaxID=1307 RepID=UPI000CF3E40D|nr:hypothetical protein [Streptococcus suis]MCB2922217.1 hypothetical protein [Streptococcus suis]MCB2932073.1 hypothetical protein [Streptococcus suis]MCB2941252.1 hypothetical protein [Streptococcus suis]MCB2941699.1 hypothetical protein [Streptococcus suis]MCB2945771.1 hypothetical protein [Streptococcus suis]